MPFLPGGTAIPLTNATDLRKALYESETKLGITTGDSGKPISSTNPKTIEKLYPAGTGTVLGTDTTVYKLTQGQQNVIRAISSFDNTEVSSFLPLPSTVTLDGTMHFITTQTLTAENPAQALGTGFTWEFTLPAASNFAIETVEVA